MDGVLSRFSGWLGEFCRLHQVNVQILDASGRTLIGPVREPAFCTTVKCARPAGCPEDCGRSRRGGPRSSIPQLFRCPYHLSNIAWVVRPAQGDENHETWTVILGRTLATQEQMTSCLEVVQETEEIGDEALAALGSIPWLAEPQLSALARFMQTTLEMVLHIDEAPPPAPAGAEAKGQAPSRSRRK